MISFLLSLLLFTPHPPQVSPWPYQHIHKKDGLSNSAINAIYMDRHQYVWFGTWDGLNRYDGTSLKVYKPDSFIKGTISNNIVRNLLEDKEGNLWIVTHKGINKYNRDTDTFTSYLANLEGIPFLEYNTRACLGPDSSIWVNVVGQGASRYDKVKDTFVPIRINGISNAWMRELTGMGSYNSIVYMLGSDGQLVSTFNGNTIYRKQIIEKEKLRLHYFFLMNGKYYLAIANHLGNLLVFDLSDIEAQPVVITLSGFPVSSLSSSRNNTLLWVGTELGDIYRVSISDGKFKAEDMASNLPQFSESRRKILSITETGQDLLWVGTDGEGVFKFLTRHKPFESFSSNASDEMNISNSIVRSVFEDKDGTLYIGTRGGGLNIITTGQGKAKVLNTTHGLSHNTVLSINKDKQGNIWLGTDGEGIDMIEAGTKKLFHFPRDFSNHPNIAFGNVYDICVDAYGSVWLGTSGSGVVGLKISKGKNHLYHLDDHHQITYSAEKSESASINSNVVYNVVEEMPNILWFGTRGAGIYRYNTLTQKIEEHFHSQSPERHRLSNDDVLSLYVGTNDDLWIGTSGGLNKLTLQRRSYYNTHFTQYEGLPNNTIHGILEDKKGMIWLSTNNGLILFDPEHTTFKTFDVNDGLQNNEFTDGASFRSSGSNKLFFGGINGLDVIYPDKIDTALSFPRLAISEFQVHNMMITASGPDKILQQHIDATQQLSLEYDQNFISFHFTTLDYWHKQRTEYAYFLKNFDQDWNNIGTQNVVNLTNIPPGSYELFINYKKNGVWNPSPKIINITVHPPFWRTTWAYAVYVTLIIGLQAGIILYLRQRGKMKRAAAIDKFKILQMKELNDYKLQFFTNIAHEFRTPLTLILGPVSNLIKRVDSLWEKGQLKTIYNNSLRMQKLLDELLQFRKIESGKDHLKVSETELVSFTQEIVNSFAQHAIDHDVHLEFIPQDENIKGWIDKRKIEKVLINLISNAIKYNIKGGTVDVLLQQKDNHAHFTVKDSGQGIDPRQQDKIFEIFYDNHQKSSAVNNRSVGIGLSLTRSLVQVHQGTITLRSEVGRGSEFTIVIPIDRASYQTESIDDNIIVLPPNSLAEKVSQEFSQSFLTEGIIPFVPSEEKNLSSTVLIVEDNEQIVILLKNILADKYHTLSAKNGNEALVMLEEKRIDLVISDILMPGMDGLTLCRKIKDNIQTSHIPVILLTAKAEIEDRIEGLQVGADSYIPKPFHPDHLFTRIEKLIQNREQVKKKFSNLATVELDKISTGMGEKDDEFFIKITQCIQQHLSEPEFTADVIAEEVGMSKASLYKKVKAITNLTPHGLIKQYRLRKAADLLQTKNMSVSEVIYETGFNSRSYFYKSFNDMFHCHPKDYGSKAG
jgi:signal transduction histidine kinase/DNA-binding response OmpR family regulator/ligand-binding sensor domain-containing protein